MSPAGRALLGAALGALITLCIDPTSRPFMTSVATRTAPDAIRDCVDSTSLSLPPPTTLSQASLWMQLAAHRIITRQKLSKKELTTVLAIAKAAEAKQSTNAFWPQMEAVLYDADGQTQNAINAWARASLRTTWGDYQPARLIADRAEIVKLTGVRQSWQLAYLYYARSDDVAYCIRSVARMILARADYDTAPGLTLRYQTLLNGALLRDHARSTKSSVTAMDIVIWATYPSDGLTQSLVYSPSPRMVLGGKDRVLNNLRTILHQPDWAANANKIFDLNDAVRALTVHRSNEFQAELLAIGSVLCASVASSVVVVAAFGGVIWLVGKFTAWRLAGHKQIKPIVVALVAAALAGLTQILTGYLPAAIAAALCAAFLVVAPDRSRKARPDDLGPLFTMVSMMLGLLCASMLAAFLIGTTRSANAVFPEIGVPPEYTDRPLWAGVAAVSFGLVLVIAPIWAVVHRVGTPHVLSLALTKFGAFVGVTGLFLSVILGPVSVYTDSRLESTLYELVTNEYVHYYLQK